MPPRQLSWSVDDLRLLSKFIAHHPSQAAAARALGVAYSTLWRWQFTDHAPSNERVMSSIRDQMQKTLQPKKAESRKKNR